MRVLATRPQTQNTEWAALLRDHGFTAFECPLLRIFAVDTHEQRRAIINLVLNLDQYQVAIFVSQNAVEHAFTYVKEYWPQLPVGLDWLGVGKKTRALLNQFLEEGSCFFDGPPDIDVMNSEDLLSLEALQSVNEKKVIIFRGVGGRDLIRQTLESRGAEVHYCELYQRSAPESLEQDLQHAQLTNDDVIPVFSGESLHNLDKVLSTGKAGDAEPILILPGERVAAMAKELGYERYQVAKNASVAEMLKAIQNL